MGNDKKTAKDVFGIIIRKLWEKNKSVLITCASVKEFFPFTFAMKVLIDQRFDMTEFFGGMSMFRKSKSLLRSIGLESVGNEFTDEINDEMGMLTVGRTSFDIYCVGILVWDLLLFCSICQRPRRSIDMWDDVLDTLVVHAFNTLPLNVFPCAVTMYNKIDDITHKNRLCRLDDKRKNFFIVRQRNQQIFSREFVDQYPAKTQSLLLEDEAHMTHLLEICCDMKIKDYLDFPLCAWPVSLNLLRGVTYPFVRYEKTRVTSKIIPQVTEICVFINPSSLSLQVFIPVDTEQELNQNMSNFEWKVDVIKVHDYMVGRDSNPKILSFGDILSSIFSNGFGPIPIYQRPSVCVSIDGSSRVFSVIHHQKNRGGCKNYHRECFFCIYEPFYHIQCGDECKRCRAQDLRTRVLPVGSTLYLDIQSQEFKGIVKYSNVNEEGSDQVEDRENVEFDDYGVPFVNEIEDREFVRQHMRNSHKFLEVRIDTPRNYTPQFGKIYVSFMSQDRVDITSRMNSIYISPENLRTSLDPSKNEVKLSVIYKA